LLSGIVVNGAILVLIFGSASVELRAPMAVVQISGIIVSTFITLFIIPIGYTIMDRLTPAGRRER
jgi:multidrug efflux pump subunit AcrB